MKIVLISKEKLFSIVKYTISTFLFLIVSYLLLAISFAVIEKKELFKRIEGMKLIVSNLESYKKTMVAIQKVVRLQNYLMN